jgi:hypothetical protein
VTGNTNSVDFPTTPGAFDTTYNGFEDAFVTKLNATGSALVYSTFLGGTGNDLGAGIVAGTRGRAYVTGNTTSVDYPTTRGAFDRTFNGGAFPGDAFVTKLNATGSALVYSTFLGGMNEDEGNGITVLDRRVYVTGNTQSADYPTTQGAFDTTLDGNGDAFVTKLNATGSALAYSTFLGGASFDQGNGIAVLDRRAYVTGSTFSDDFPTTPGAFDRTFNSGAGASDVFVTKLNATGSALTYSTFLGGTGDDQGNGIAVLDRRAYVTGLNFSFDFPTTQGAFDTTYNGRTEAFVTKLNAAGSALDYSTFLGGMNEDEGRGIAVDGEGRAYVTGNTNSSDFPTTPGAFDTTYNGGFSDGFVTKLPTG